MKKNRIFTIVACAILAACSNQPQATKQNQDNDPKPAEAASSKKDTSYALGYNIGEMLVKTDEQLSVDDLIQGFKDAFNKVEKPRFNEEERKDLLMKYNVELGKAMREKMEQKKQANIEKGKEFMADFEKQPGVKKDASGFMYKVIEQGNGPIPKADDKVEVDYTGKKIDGTVFFSSKEQGAPAEFKVKNLIPGLVAALQQMPVGSTWEIVLPPDLAYREMGVPDTIEPAETLIFEIHLIKIDAPSHEELKGEGSEKPATPPAPEDHESKEAQPQEKTAAENESDNDDDADSDAEA